MRPKLLITTDCFLPRWDGIARFLTELIPHLMRNFDITVVAPDFKGEFKEIPGIRVIRFPLTRIRFGDIHFTWFHHRRMRKILREHDLVVNQTIGPIGMNAIKHSHALDRKVVSYVHNIEWELASKSLKHFNKLARVVVKKLARSLYNKCTKLLVPSAEVEDLLTLNGVRVKKQVVHLGVDTEKFSAPLVKSKVKELLGIPRRKKVIGYVGRLAREKNLITLKKAFLRVSRWHPDSMLLIIGSGIESELLQGKNIVLAGSRKDVPLLLQAMDIYVLPSLTETSSLSTMEAMASGLAVVVTPVGSLREYIVEGKNGMFFPRKDVKNLAENLDVLLRNTPLRAELGRNARKTIVKHYHWDDTTKNIRRALLEEI